MIVSHLPCTTLMPLLIIANTDTTIYHNTDKNPERKQKWHNMNLEVRRLAKVTRDLENEISYVGNGNAICDAVSIYA